MHQYYEFALPILLKQMLIHLNAIIICNMHGLLFYLLKDLKKKYLILYSTLYTLLLDQMFTTCRILNKVMK